MKQLYRVIQTPSALIIFSGIFLVGYAVYQAAQSYRWASGN